MPDLPTFSVTQAQANRLLAAFQPDENDIRAGRTTPTQVYLHWYKYAVLTELRVRESRSQTELPE